MVTYEQLPDDLPEPLDDGAADHLPGMALPQVTLPTTTGSRVDLSSLSGLNILYVYPMTGRPGAPLPEGWDSVPGARGCTPESCGFRDHIADLRQVGVSEVFGVSSQSTDVQREARDRLLLPFELVSDGDFAWAEMLGLPTFTLGSGRFHCRLTLVVRDGRIVQVFYPVFPPDTHAASVLRVLRDS